MKPLPLGIQTFRKLRKEGKLYIDKTKQIHQLISNGGFFFLSRPRRFGKSLMLSTIGEIFSGSKNLFKGLWIENNWNWEEKHPVIHLEFSGMAYRNLGLDAAISKSLVAQAEKLGVELVETITSLQFKELIQKVATKENSNAIILMDEYDKPLIDFLKKEDLPQAKENQKILKSFYSIIKGSDEYIKFVLITGVSKFSKVSIFSDLNNITDISLNWQHADLVGYTQEELENHFEPYFLAAEKRLKLNKQELLEKLKFHYNGYNWNADVSLYNPWSILSFFYHLSFRNFWFETGTPTFLLELMKQEQKYQFDNLLTHEFSFSTYDLENIRLLPLLFQTGYLTIKSKEDFDQYRLDYPNKEVRDSLLGFMISEFGHKTVANSTPTVTRLNQAFLKNDIKEVIKLIKSVFKNIPHQIFIADKEFYYHSLVYLVFFYLGQYTDAEISTNDGRLDAVVKTSTHLYIIEFKLDKSAKAAINQIKKRDYHSKYAADGREKVLLGINFSSKQKTVEDWILEKV